MADTMTSDVKEKINATEKERKTIVQSWIDQGLCTEPANRERAEEGVRLAYKAVGLPPPSKFYWLGSPMAGFLTALIIRATKSDDGKELLSKLPKIEDKPISAVDRMPTVGVVDLMKHFAPFDLLPNDDIRNVVQKVLIDSIGSNGKCLTAEVVDKAKLEAYAQITSIKGSMHDYYSVAQDSWNTISRVVGERLFTMMTEKMLSHMNKDLLKDSPLHAFRTLHSCGHGQHEGYWLAFLSYLRQVLKVELPLDTEGLDIIGQSCGWWWPFDDMAIMTDRPSAIKLDERNRLHSSDSMALAYRDGWGCYAYHGMAVEERIIMHPETITAKEILGEQNVEIRRIKTELYGTLKFFHDAGGKKISSDSFGELWSLDMGDRDEPMVYVKVLNSTPEPDGSIKSYTLRVPPTTETAKAAVAWTFGLEDKEYSPNKES